MTKENTKDATTSVDDLIERLGHYTPPEAFNGQIGVDIMEAAQALQQQKQELEEAQKETAQLSCPKAYGFEGPETFSDCGKCVVCRAKAFLKKIGEKG